MAVIALGVFFPMAINTYAGVREADPLLVRAAVAFGAGRWSVIRKVVLPSALPMVFAGLRLGAGTALLLLVAAEMIARRLRASDSSCSMRATSWRRRSSWSAS